MKLFQIIIMISPVKMISFVQFYLLLELEVIVPKILICINLFIKSRPHYTKYILEQFFTSLEIQTLIYYIKIYSLWHFLYIFKFNLLKSNATSFKIGFLGPEKLCINTVPGA